MRRTRPARTTTAALTATAVMALGLAAAGPAEASAYGCTPYTKVRIKGVSPANWCGGPNGKGRRVDNVIATFASSLAGVGYLCDTRMKVEVLNDRGQTAWSAFSPTTGGCVQAGGAFRVDVNRTFPTRGTVRTSLLSYGATLATLSHNIR